MLEESLRLKEKLEEECLSLKKYFEENKDSSISAVVLGVEMYFDPEILIKEKENEIENVNMFYDEYLKISQEISSVTKNIAMLKEEKEEDAIFYYNGVPFEFKTGKVIMEMERKLFLLNKHHSGLKEYFKTGKLTY